MTDQLPGRIPPWASGVWSYQTRPPVPPARTEPVRTEPVRIGDAERDDALERLGDHFAAGRLTREELDERTDQAIGARFDRDLEALFRDLPERPRAVVARPAPPRAAAVLPVAVMVLVPLLALMVVVSVVTNVPLLIGPVVWVLLLSGMGRRYHHR